MAKKIKKEIGQASFNCVLDCGGTLHKSSGETIVECLEKLHPEVLKTRSTLTISQGDKTASVIFFPLQIKKILVSKVFREILQKRLLNSLH